MRQFPGRYAIRARRNLPDKEIRSIFPSFVYQPLLIRAQQDSIFILLITQVRMLNIWSLVGLVWTMRLFLGRKVTMARAVYIYNRSSPLMHFSKINWRNTPNLRTIIVIADIDRGLYSPAKQTEVHFTPRI